ncbi:NUDIX domain-containing protein [Phytomonospora sp. NPDC050363]|uniref:NUDIX domain-containing protein n=1 Tax=Phytomonospora sp. NPDC050363 TaxID=3155642 RepID=UPI0033F3B948
MMIDDYRKTLTAFIKSVPGHDESPVSVQELCSRSGDRAPLPTASGNILVELLAGFGVLRIAESTPGVTTVKAAAPAAHLFLSSLAHHIAEKAPILEDWSRPGTVDPPYSGDQALAGAQFLYLLERRRLCRDPSAAPLRRVEVAQVLVNRRTRKYGTVYLVLHDDIAGQFQLPGGHRRSGDHDLRATALRELNEELPRFVFDPAFDELVELGTVETTQVSRTYGAATAYRMKFFHLRSSRGDIPVGPHARWISERHLLSEHSAVEGQTLNLKALHDLACRLPEGIGGLALSLSPPGTDGVIALFRGRSLEFWGLIVGLVGLLASILFFIWS